VLNRLLDLLREGGTRRIRNLADELETTPELIGVMLEDLARRGYLRRVGAACSDKCRTCSVSGMCVAGGSLHEEPSGQGAIAWALVEEPRTK
jgi:DNA-binding Lrp family transcriptional regulator